jgi:hypothetical protein
MLNFIAPPPVGAKPFRPLRVAPSTFERPNLDLEELRKKEAVVVEGVEVLNGPQRCAIGQAAVTLDDISVTVERSWRNRPVLGIAVDKYGPVEKQTVLHTKQGSSVEISSHGAL